MNEIISPAEIQGQQIILLLKNPNNLKPSLYSNQLLTDEEGNTDPWETFVTFPSELSTVFPGSYIPPKIFLQELGISEDVDNLQQQILGNDLGSVDKPTLRYPPTIETDNSFSLTVLNGLTNEHALAMTKFQYQGFNDSGNRAQYQNHMFESIAAIYDSQQQPAYGIRIFDDCIASADSIVGKLSKLRQENNPFLEQGVEVTAVTATAQAILFLKAFAESLGIDLKIRVGQLAFGLTSGIKKENGVRKHANYMTYPEELLPLLKEEVVNELRKYAVDIDGENVIQVVGDMGAGSEGIIEQDMAKIREELDNLIYCWWNDTREDSHGAHPNHNKLLIPSLERGKRLVVYLARGGYLPLAWDKKLYQYFSGVDILILRLARLWTEERGYGVGMKKL